MSSPDVAPVTAPLPRAGFGDPAALAVVAFTLAVLCLMGSSVLSGLPYVMTFADQLGSGQDEARWYLFGGSLLSVVFALVPFLLGRRGLARMTSDGARWIEPLLRGAVVLAAVAMVLRLVMAALALGDDSSGLSFIFNYR